MGCTALAPRSGSNENDRKGARGGRNEPFTWTRDGGRCASWLSARLMFTTRPADGNGGCVCRGWRTKDEG